MNKLWALFPFCALVTACGSSDDSEPPPGNDPYKLTFTTGQFEIPTGDSFECFYTSTITDTELSVSSALGKQADGGHHITVYYTTEAREPQHHPCVDAEMTEWNQVAGAGESTDQELSMPEGFATRIPAGAQLVVQAHYINLDSQPRTVEDQVTLQLVDPATVRHYVNYLATLDLSFEVSPNAEQERVTYCTLERDFEMILGLPHMHELGVRYRLEIADASGAPTQNILQTDPWSPVYTSHPPVTHYSEQEPLRLAKGTRLRQSCTWKNTTAEPLKFPREMCLAFFYYYPDDGEQLCVMLP